MMPGDPITAHYVAALAWLYAASGLATNLFYLPQILLLWRSAEARRAQSFTAWVGWVVLDLVALAYALLVARQPEMILVAVVNLVPQATVVALIIGQLALELARRGRTAAPVAVPAPVPAPADGGGAMLRRSGQRPFLYLATAGDKGLGLYAARSFAAGAILVADDDGSYYRNMVTAREARARGLDLVQSCFQVADDGYLLPTGVVDDFINHACAPNAGIRLTERGYELVALSDIAAHSEITYDYSTYISRHGREVLDCRCGSPACHRRVSAFAELPAELQRFYLGRGVVAPYIRRALGFPGTEGAGAEDKAEAAPGLGAPGLIDRAA